MSSHDVLEIQLLDFRTGFPHPEAIQSTLCVDAVAAAMDSAQLDVTIDVSGETLALVIFCAAHDTRSEKNALYLYNWKLGVLRTPPIPVRNSGLVFLANDILMHPVAWDGIRLDIYHIPPLLGSTSHGQIRLLKSFMLPQVVSSGYSIGIECRCKPNPCGDQFLPFDARPFHTSAASSILQISLKIRFGSQQFSFTFQVHRKILLLPQYIGLPGSYQPPNFAHKTVPWAEWGPNNMRWVQ
ncbi:hypothetical protein B0H10DRAFT_1937961 [Mycena sp. CBHHK59/15]|nr:hypothetical protein B0H10DRAFT_1937961 [Mycena sp. CBHHK59/15]